MEDFVQFLDGRMDQPKINDELSEALRKSQDAIANAQNPYEKEKKSLATP